MLFDTGYSDAFFEATRPFPERLYRWLTPVELPQEQRLASQLRQRGYGADDVTHIVLSHLHADHMAGLRDFPRARLTVMRAEVDAMRDGSRIGRLRRGYLRTLLPPDFETRLSCVEDAHRVALPASMQPFAEGFDLFDDGTLIAVPLPGHTPGQIGLLFTTANDRPVFLVADACWSLDAVRADRPPSRIASTIFSNRRAYLDTFAALRRLTGRHPSLHVLPSHCRSSRQRLVDEGS